MWLYNPHRKKGGMPTLDVPWEGPYAVVTIMSGVLCEIQQSKCTKSRIVHMDKLDHVRGQYDGSWVTSLPSKREQGIDDDHLKGVKELSK